MRPYEAMSKDGNGIEGPYEAMSKGGNGIDFLWNQIRITTFTTFLLK
jgi:hypothetical protein